MDFSGIQANSLQALGKISPELDSMLSSQQQESAALQRQFTFNPDIEPYLQDSTVREQVLIRLRAIAATQDLGCHILELLHAKS